MEKEIYSQYINWLWKQQEGCGGIYRNTPNGEHSSAKSNGPAQKHSPIFTTHFFTFLLENCRTFQTFLSLSILYTKYSGPLSRIHAFWGIRIPIGICRGSGLFFFLWAVVLVFHRPNWIRIQIRIRNQPLFSTGRRKKSAREIATKYSHDCYKIIPNCNVKGTFLWKRVRTYKKNQAYSASEKKYFLNCKSFA